MPLVLVASFSFHLILFLQSVFLFLQGDLYMSFSGGSGAVDSGGQGGGAADAPREGLAGAGDEARVVFIVGPRRLVPRIFNFSQRCIWLV